MRHAVLALLALTLAPIRIDAQARRFDKRRDLDGYEEAYFSEWSSLFRFEEFDALEGRLLDPDELAEWQRRWQAEVERVHALVAAAEADPVVMFDLRLGMKLARHPYFSRITFEHDSSHAPLSLYVQTTAGTPRDHVRKVVQRLGPPLAALIDEFEERYAVPAELERREDQAGLALMVLASRGDFDNYHRICSPPFLGRGWAGFEPELRLGVCLLDPFDEALTPEVVLVSAKRALAQILLSAHAPRLLSGESWWERGLGVYLSERPLGAPALPPPPPDPLRRFVRSVGDPEARVTCFHRTGELVGLRDDHLFGFVLKQRQPRGPIDWTAAYHALIDESELLVAFLHEQPWADAFPLLLADELAGRGGHTALTARLGLHDLTTFDRDFLTWAFDAHAAAFPSLPLDRRAIDAALGRRPEPPGAPIAASAADTNRSTTRGAAEAPPEPASSKDDAAFSPRELFVDDPSDEERFALALDAAHRGRFDLARDRVADLLADRPQAALVAPLEEELARLSTWTDLRDRWLAERIESGESFAVVRDRGREVLTLLGREGTELTVRSRRGEVFELSLPEIDGAPLALAMGVELRKRGPAWLRGYLLWLAGDERWPRHLRGRDDATRALVALLEGDHARRLDLGLALGELDDLATYDPPFGIERARDLAARVRALLADHGDEPAVVARRPALETFAGLALGEVFDADPTVDLHGKIERIGEDAFRLRYDFERPEELEDFLPFRASASQSKGYGKLFFDDHENALRIEKGTLTGTGHAAYRHAFGLAAPFTIRYRARWDAEGKLGSANVILFVGLGDATGRRFAGVLADDTLDVFDDLGRRSIRPEASEPLYLDADYEIVLVHDGTTMTLITDGREQVTTTVSGLDHGALTIVLHSDHRVHLWDLEIEGHLSPEALAPARKRWIAAQIEGM